MKEIYAILYKPKNEVAHVSSEAYENLDDAKEFIKKRCENENGVIREDGLSCQTETGYYVVQYVLVKEAK